ncbi:two-component system nitrogen regulation sensor histidine kinase NtrY [Pedobacter sp. UYP30]|uniref:sensor histidine kinase n=1 Tax=Pedobacter sp. UYP30 TaxID=1756400 RepID=UPI003396A3C0
MGVGFGIKIRFLLLVLGCLLIATSVSLRQFSTKAEILDHDAKEVEHNLLLKEKSVKDFLAGKGNVERLKTFPQNAKEALSFIDTYRKYGINLYSYQNEKLQFWSTFKIPNLNPKTIKSGTSVVFLSNGWYEVIKQTNENFDFVFFIPIQSQYGLKESSYFSDAIDPLLSTSKKITLASFTDKEVYAVRSLDNKFLFALKLKPNFPVDYMPDLQIWLFVAGLLFIAAFFNSLASFIAKKGYIGFGTILLAAFFLAFRLTDLYYGWFNHRFVAGIFDPKIYSQSFLMPSLGDLIANITSLTWLFLFVFNHRKYYQFPQWVRKYSWTGILIHLLFLVAIGTTALLADDILFGLIYNSKINFDIINILKLSGSSWLSIVIVCLIWFQLYLITVIFAVASKQLKVSNTQRIYILCVAFLVVLIYNLATAFNVFFIAFFLVLFLVARYVYLEDSKFNIGLFAAVFICLSFITSVKYLEYKNIAEESLREPLARKVQSSDDPNAILALGDLEDKLLAAKLLPNFFSEYKSVNYAEFKSSIKSFLAGYLSRYDFQVYSYNKEGKPLTLSNTAPFSKYRNLVESGAIKVDGSMYFYQVNNTFGYQNYFGIIPVVQRGGLIGTLIIELRSKPYNYNNRLPDLLGDQKLINNQDFKGYSIALYSNERLLNQSGSFTYPLNGMAFGGKLNDFIYINDNKSGYNHLVFKPSLSKLVVISKANPDYIERMAVLSFFFIVFIVFSLVLFGLVWIVKNLEDDKVGWFTVNRSLMINANKILYKTRIQLSVVLAVVATLIIVGWITYFYMDKEYRSQQNDIIKQKIRTVQQNFEKQVLNTDKINKDATALAGFESFSEINNADLNLYDVNGNLVTTTYPKLYNYKVLGRKMGASAYIYLKYMQRSEYINPQEKLGTLTYAAAYAPIRNAQSKTIAFIGLPNYLNEEEYSSKIALFLSNLINIYALVFVGTGVLAIFLAKQITNPLTFIQQNIRKTKLGQRNEPIIWRRHDELGSLIKEYNNLIAELEESAKKLARSERESAWREMAKQVAHEIKNPLTPLRLGVQLLEKSWKENDVNFELKFNRFSKSFIEQIDSLSRIASEFSHFAKMPDAILTKINVLAVLEKSAEVYESSENVHIVLLDKSVMPLEIMADSDQMLRTFNNLFKNAIEASTENTFCKIEVSLLNDLKNVYLEIKDNGNGIPNNVHDQIFVPNFTTKTSGTGLGLAFVKQAIDNAGGTVSFTSTSKGTTFFLSFPLA